MIINSLIMFWRKEKKDDAGEKRLVQINELLKLSFGNVKRDTTNIFKWLNYLYRRNMEQEQLIKQLQLELSYAPKTREDIRRIIDEYYSFEGMMAKIRDLNTKIDEMTTINEQKQLSMKEKIVKKITRNSKDYVKNIIISYIRKYERVSALQLKEIVVDEQDLCSKSSFYRLLEEIEQSDEIAVIRQGKEKHYLLKI